MKITEFDWKTETANWAIIENEYGKLMSYNLPRYHKAYANGTYQGYIIDMLKNGNYDLFIDLGAYVGYFSLVASHYCKNVFAYEAHPFYYGILLLNMRNIENVSCRYRFISCNGDIPKMSDDVRGLSSIQYENEYKVPVFSLNQEFEWSIETWEKINMKILVKMDIEGSEEKALSEASLLIQNPNIHWIIDIHDQHGVSIEKIKSYFKRRNITLISPKVLKVE